MSQYWDTGEVKLRIANLFKADLGFMKASNLAGELVGASWPYVEERYKDCNYEQKALVCLINAAKELFAEHRSETMRISTYLWCHQKVTLKRRWWFFSIKNSAADRSRAALWFVGKASALAIQTRQSEFLARLKSGG